MLPKKADWIKQKVVSFDPKNNSLKTEDGEEITYEFLVVAMGLQLNYHLVSTISQLFNIFLLLTQPLNKIFFFCSYYTLLA